MNRTEPNRIPDCLQETEGAGMAPPFTMNEQICLQTLGGSFSSVSKPIFASKYAFCSIFRDLKINRTFAPLQIQNSTLN